MLVLLILVILVIFPIMAWVNRGKTADAAHVILVAGFGGCFAVLILAAIAHSNELRNFDRDVQIYIDCTERVSRSEEANLFNRTLVEVLEERLPGDPDVARLRAALLEPLHISICGVQPKDEPQFINSLL